MVKNQENRTFGVVEKEIFNICERISSDNDGMLIDVVFRGREGNLVIEVFIDREDHMSVEDCATISRLIVDEIEQEDIVKGTFRLDVSSPGTDRPLRFLKQYKKHLNRNFEVILRDNNSDKKKITGKLISIDGDNLIFKEKDSEYPVKFENIQTAKVLITFSDGGKK